MATLQLRSVFSVRNALLVAVLAVTSAFTLTAFAQPGGWGGRGGEHGGGHGMFMAGRMVERMLDRVNATPDQRAQIKKITESAATDMKAHRESGKGLREQGLAVFTAPNVDANAVEALRQKRMAHHDQASRRISQAMLEVSRVLTPDQRKQLADQMAKRGDMMKRHQHERQQLDGQRKG